MFYDLKTGNGYSIFGDPERIKYKNTTTPLRELMFMDGYVAIELIRADGKDYFAVINKNGETVYGPEKRSLLILRNNNVSSYHTIV